LVKGMWWTIVLNYWLKSNRRFRAQWFGWSVTLYRWWAKDKSEWVVDKPESDAKSFPLIRCLICNIIHSATKRSIVLERNGVRDIGRKLFSISLTTTDFGIGITFACFHRYQQSFLALTR
jgi:hypothetical protein